ncbi:MAG: NAD(P)-dependent oxidoreductase [Rhodospirillales bacterium]|nr:NAD(P)-dependent oxidoreductase [Rhodospirillales bacterium]
MDAGRSLGIIGLGLVGRAFAERARRMGWRVTGFDPSPVATGVARAAGVEIRSDAAAVADGCGTVLVAVFDGPQLVRVADALLRARRRPRLVLSCVTSDAATAESVGRRLEAAAISFVDMPLSGSSQQIAAGEALAMAGAGDHAWSVARAVVAALAPRHVRVGAAGAGARAKLATNLVLGLNRAALAEGLAFAEALGLGGATFLDLLRRSPAYSRAVDVAGPRMLTGAFTPVSRIAQHRKDVALILDAAAGAGLELTLERGHAALLDAAIAAGDGDLDNAAIIRIIRGRKPSSATEPDPCPPSTSRRRKAASKRSRRKRPARSRKPTGRSRG